MFADREAFVEAHRPCGDFTADVGDQTSEGYGVHASCSCGAVAEYWVTPEIAAKDLIRTQSTPTS